MIVFYTTSTKHFAECIKARAGACTIKQFSDGEVYVRVDEDVRDKEVWVLSATNPPAEHAFELFFLLDALQRSGARINLFITYFGYARQVIAQPGEALSAHVISSCIQQFSARKIYIMHPHSTLLHNFLSFTAVYKADLFCKFAALYDAVAAPDTGVADFAREIAKACNKDLIILTKTRPAHEEVVIEAVDGDAHDKKILLIDDIISTGRTIVHAASILKQRGAKHVAAAAIHGVFAPGARDYLQVSPLDSIFVTNTIGQQSGGKITVIDISTMIEEIMEEARIS
ncbi:MAG: ribose-phosphate diphosphokinase [Candidatus Babeliales bacterium]